MNAKRANEVVVTETETQSGDFDALLRAPGSQRAPAPAQTSELTDPPVTVEADIDGKRVRIVAKDEIVLECGEASITLRRNGRIVIKGTYVETCSEGTNRIKGGQVRIN